MKKKSIIILLYSIFISGFLHSQDLKITYLIENTFDFKKASDDILRQYPGEQTQRLIQAQNQSRLIASKSTYTLAIYGVLSHFYLNSSLENEAFDQNINKLAQLISDKGTFYQNTKSKNVIEKLSTNDALITYDFSFYEWELINETQEILGYTCYKAIVYYEDQHPMTGASIPRNITVWYAPDLPAYFGPEGFGGLPGLILKKCLKGNCIVATEIKENLNEISLPKGNLLTRKEFQKKLRNTNFGF